MNSDLFLFVTAKVGQKWDSHNNTASLSGEMKERGNRNLEGPGLSGECQARCALGDRTDRTVDSKIEGLLVVDFAGEQKLGVEELILGTDAFEICP